MAAAVALPASAAHAAAAGPAPDLADIRQRLGKRGTFEGAAADLTSVLLRRARCRQLDTARGSERMDAEVWETVRRTFALLRSRYTAVAFWRAGRMLAQAALAAAATPAEREAARGYLAAAQAHLQEAEALECPAGGAAQPACDARSYLFEGQMSAEDEAPPRAPGIQDLLAALVSGTMPGSDAATITTAAQDAPDSSAAAQQPPNSGAQQQDRARALDQLFETFRDAFGGDNTEGLEEALRASLEDDRAMGPPPAAKSAVRALQRERLTPERLQQLGGKDVQCAVCREQLATGEEVQLMPCHDGHVFHPPCLAPWLQQHNSCPVCRHELPTDDADYERRKRWEAAVAEDARGAANALSHNEFMYI